MPGQGFGSESTWTVSALIRRVPLRLYYLRTSTEFVGARMRRLFSLVLFAVLTASTSLFARQGERPALAVSCSADRTSYTAGDSVKLTLTLENRGSSDFYVYRTIEWGWAGVRFRLADAAGNIVPEPDGNRPSLPTPPIYDKSDIVGLAPGYFFGTHLRIDLSRYKLNPGVYYIQVAYQSNHPHEEGSGLPIVTMADGAFLSNKVQVEVRAR